MSQATPIVWAGIALRYADGTVIAIEVDHPHGRIEVVTEEIDVSGGLYRRTVAGRQRVDAELSGPLSRGWRVGEEAARQHAAQAITAGPVPISASPGLPSGPVAGAESVAPPGD